MVDKRILVAPAERQFAVFSLRCKVELVKRTQADVYIPVLEQFVVKVFLGKIGVKCKQGVVFLGGICERCLSRGALRPVFAYLALGGAVVGFRLLGHAQHILYVRSVEICLCKVWVQFDGLVIVCQSVTPAPHSHKESGPVVICKHVSGIDVYDAVHIFKGVAEISHLGIQKRAVIECQGIAGLFLQHAVEVAHG